MLSFTPMKDLSEVAKLRISKDPKKRSQHMANIRKQGWSKVDPEERSAHAKMMRKAQLDNKKVSGY